ncbi:SCO family protein [Elioraea thermophila]|uniref:SCO family protein n=1 Tax=Elioraea thermophila TaxID=2185104 RepID=UPI0018E56510|nr:SCO family protein [Elioraea thermophila]
MTTWQRIGLAIVTAAVAGGAAWLVVPAWLSPPKTHQVQVALPAGVTLGGPFALTDETGARVTNETFRGRFMLIYFGFTYCPDVCPTELAKMAAALDLLGAEAEEVVPILITVDPERDTPAALAQYTDLFHPRLVGLTGTEAEIAAAARAYRAYYAKVRTGPGPDEYTMDHSAFIYLMGRQGEFIALFNPQTTPEQMAEAMRRAIAAAPRVSTMQPQGGRS